MEPKKGGMKKLRARFDSAKKQIDRVKKEGADVKPAASLLIEAEQSMKVGDEAKTTEILDNIEQMLKQAKAKRKYEMMIFNSLPVIEKAKRAGANVSASEVFLAKARELLDSGSFGEAHEQIKMARREADNAKHFMTAKAHIQRVAPLVEAAKRKGVNVQDATNTILESWRALNEGNYDYVTELIKKATTQLNIAEEQKGYDVSIKDMEARIITLRESGIDTKNMETVLEEAKQSMIEKNYGDVRTCVNKIRREVEKIILRREADLTLKTIQQFARETKRAGIKSEELENMLEKASIAINAGDFTQVRTIELSAKQAVKNLKLFDIIATADISTFDKEREEGFTALIREELADSRSLVESAGASGMDVSGIMKMIGEAEAALNTNQLNRSFELARQVKQLVQSDAGGFQSADVKRELEEVLANLEEARVVGIDVADAEMLALEAKANVDEKGAATANTIKRAAAALEDAVRKGSADKHPRLKVNIHSDGFEVQKWGRASIDISNNGNSIAKNIEMGFFGDVEVKGWETIPKLLPGQSDCREIAVRTFKTGKIPLDMTVNYSKSFDQTKFQLNDIKEVDVAESGTFIVEDAFLIHNSGILISKQTRRIREEVDGDLFSAMLTAITQFAKDSFNTEDKVALSRLEFGSNQVLIERGNSFFMAVTLLGEESVYMPFYISEVVREIDEKFGAVLEHWSGEMKQVEGVGDLVKKVLLIRNGECGLPDYDGSILHPVFETMKNGAEIQDFDSKIRELLMSYEGELISGSMGEVSEILGKIHETAKGCLRTDATTKEHSNKEGLLRESMQYELDAVRSHMNKQAEMGADISREEGLLRESVSLLGQKNYEKTSHLLAEIRESLKGKEKAMAAESFSRRLGELREALTTASGMGIDVSEIETMAADVEKTLTEGPGENLDNQYEQIMERLERKTRGFMANRHPKLRVDVRDKAGHEAGSWSRMGVVVSNEGNTPARNVDLNFAGDLEVKKPQRVDIVEPNTSRDIEVSVRPATGGKLQMGVSVTYQRHFDETKFQLNDIKDLDVHAPGSYIVQDAFLIHNNGLLIASKTRRIKENVDGDIFGAMLKALIDFVRQAFNTSRKNGLDRMEFGGEKLLIEKGKSVFLAITIIGEESRYLPFFMTEVVNEIESEYSAALESWGGDLNALEGIGEKVERIIFVKQTGKNRIPILNSSILAPMLEMAAGGNLGETQLQDMDRKVAQITTAIEQEGLENATRQLVEIGTLVSGLMAKPAPDNVPSGNIDAGALKKRMYDMMIRAGHVDADSALMDARLNNYLEVVGRISDAVFGLRERNSIPADRKLAQIAIKHQEHERWCEVVGNMRNLLLEQTNALAIQILKPDDIWGGLVPAVKIDEEHIRKSYKHIAGKIISVLQYMPPEKLLANIKKGTFTIGVEGQQVYITDEMVSVSFSLPPGAFEGALDQGVIYINSAMTEEVKSDISLNALIEKINEMRRELELNEDAEIEVQILADDTLVEMLEKVKDRIVEGCKAYEVFFPLDDPFGSGEYHVGEMEMDGEKCRIGIVQVEFAE